MIFNLEVFEETIDLVYQKGFIELEDIINKYKVNYSCLRQNDAVVLSNGLKTAITILKGQTLKIIKGTNTIMKKLRAENLEQNIYVGYLQDTEIKCIVATGLAGSGKTLLAVANAYESIVDGEFQQLVLARPYVAPSKKFQNGLLPGSLEEKMKPWMEVFYDNLEKVKLITGKKNIEIKNIKEQSLEHIKGTTFDNSMFILDEAEDFTIQELSAILTRVGFGSKIVILGDIEQATENGCKHTLPDLIQKFRNVEASEKEQKMFASIDLKKSLRSEFVNFVLKALK